MALAGISWVVSDRFVRDIHTVNLYAGGAAITTAERDRRISGLGGIEVLTVLNLNAGFQLGQVKEVATIHRQVFDLGRCQNSLNSGLLGIDLNFASLYLDHRALLADFKLDAAHWRHYQP